jgi:sulfatase modifying factor 1
MTLDLETLLRAGADGTQGDPADFVVAADRFLARDELEAAASALDRAHGLAPDDRDIAEQRRDVLDRLAIFEHGLVFRYVPAGTFLMGSTTGDPDERPVHAVMLDAFWITDAPISWAAYCEHMGWEPPPSGFPEQEADDEQRMRRFHLHEANKIRRAYCGTDEDGEDEDEPGDWQMPEYDRKPMVAVGWADADALVDKLNGWGARYALPSEAQWEKAARGGLIGKRYSWGDDPPTAERCDFGHFGRFVIADPRTLASNGYGLHGMCGGIWEWTATLYDALAYAHRAAGRIALDELDRRPDDRLLALNDYHRRAGVDPGLLEQPHLRVLRGGSWADGAAAVTVSIRMARDGWGWQSGLWSGSDTPNVGFRLIRLRSPA